MTTYRSQITCLGSSSPDKSDIPNISFPQSTRVRNVNDFSQRRGTHNLSFDPMQQTAGYNRRITQKGIRYKLGGDSVTNRDSGELPSWADIGGCQLPKKIQYTPVRKKPCDEPKSAVKAVPNAFAQIR